MRLETCIPLVPGKREMLSQFPEGFYNINPPTIRQNINDVIVDFRWDCWPQISQKNITSLSSAKRMHTTESPDVPANSPDSYKSSRLYKYVSAFKKLKITFWLNCPIREMLRSKPVFALKQAFFLILRLTLRKFFRDNSRKTWNN